MRKLGKFILCVGLACMFAFTGCSLVQRNTERYLNRTVASAGDITITKRELIQAYNSYGYQYTQYYGYSAEKAIKTTLNGLIDRKILLEEAKKLIVLEDDGTVAYYKDGVKQETLFNKNVWNNSIWQETFDAVNDQIQSIEDEIKKERNITDNSNNGEDESPEFDPYKEYEKKVEYKNGKWTTIKDDLDAAEENKTTVSNFTQEETGDVEISKEAFKRYIKQLELNYKSLNLKISDLKTVDENLFKNIYSNMQLSDRQKLSFLYELERIHTSYEESKYIETLETLYNQYIQVIDDDFNQKVVDYYKQLVENSYEKYVTETEADGYTAYVSAMQSDNSKVYYHKDFGVNSKGEKKAFVAVSHVLIKLSDAQIAELKELESKRDSNIISEQEYQDSYQQVLDRTVVHVRDENGFETDETKTVQEVWAEINNDLNNYEEDDVEGRAMAFNKYIYKYGQDTGMINANNYYAVNLDTEVTDKMVKAFADESRRLANENEDGGNLGNPVFVSQDNYSGYHIIFNAGIIKNDLTIEQVRDMDYKGASYLYNKKIMLGTNKTVYDYIYDTIYTSKYSNYSNSIVETAKSQNDFKIVYYKSAYKDLY